MNASLRLDGEVLDSVEVGPSDPSAKLLRPRPEAGEYVVDVQLDTGLQQEYVLQWCAIGTDDGAPPNDACQDPSRRSAFGPRR